MDMTEEDVGSFPEHVDSAVEMAAQEVEEHSQEAGHIW